MKFIWHSITEINWNRDNAHYYYYIQSYSGKELDIDQHKQTAQMSYFLEYEKSHHFAPYNYIPM